MIFNLGWFSWLCAAFVGLKSMVCMQFGARIDAHLGFGFWFHLACWFFGFWFFGFWFLVSSLGFWLVHLVFRFLVAVFGFWFLFFFVRFFASFNLIPTLPFFPQVTFALYFFACAYININISKYQYQLPVCTAQGGSGSFKDRKPIGGWLL